MVALLESKNFGEAVNVYTWVPACSGEITSKNPTSHSATSVA